MHKVTPFAIQALKNATEQVEALNKISELSDNEIDKTEAARLTRKASKAARRLHLFLKKYSPGC
jgi:hypothetical protein